MKTLFHLMVACCAPLPITRAGPPQYTFTEIAGPPAGYLLWFAYDIGPQGRVVGRVYNYNVSPQLERGFVWQGGTMALLDGPGGDPVTEARCIDENGVIYGGYRDHRFPLEIKMHPVRWVDGTPVPYANSADICSSTIFGCSPTTGVAVGWANPFAPGTPGWQGQYGYANEPGFGNQDPVLAFIWSGGAGAVLTRSLGLSGDGARDVNDAGQVAVNLGSDEFAGAAVFDPRFGVARLPGLGVGQPYYAWGTQARAINGAGQIVGHAQGAGGAEHPVRWDRDVLTDLGLLPGFVEGIAIDINESGVIVGGLSNQNFEFGLRPTAGFVVLGAAMHNLNVLMPPGTGFVVHQAEAVNNAGQILVSMNPPPTNFATRYGVLTPVP